MKKINRFVICVLLSVMLLTQLAVSAFATSGTAVSNSVNSVAAVAVGVEKTDGSWYEFSWGTGFFVGVSGEDPQYLVTNHHVIDDFINYGSGELKTLEMNGATASFRAKIRVYFESDDFIEAYLVDSDSIKDIAVLRLEKPTDKRTPLKLCSPTEDMVGSSVWAVGYPGVAENVYISSVTSFGLKDATVTKGSLSRLVVTSGTGVSYIQTDTAIMHGHSGGPMINENGAVLGVNTWGYSNMDSEEVNYAVNIDEVIPILKQYDIPYEMYSESNTALIIVLVAIILIILAIVIVLLVKRKGKSGAASGKGTGAAPGQTDTKPRFQGINGTFAGKRYSVNGTVRFGRNPAQNDIVYPANTQGVSGVHCSLTYQNGHLYLQDLGSTYGTYLAGGRKLTPNQPVELHMGDRFYLGSEREMFAVVPQGGV